MQNTLSTRVFRVLSLLFALFVSFSIFSASAIEYIAPDVNQRVKAATVMVHLEYQSPGSEHQFSWGTGFVIGDGLIMTNAHVVRDQAPIRIFIRNEYLPVTEAKIVAAQYDPNGAGYYDVALLRFTPPSGMRLPALPFSTRVSPFESVFAFGYPGPMRASSLGQVPMVVTGGKINEIIKANPYLLMHTALCKSGNSGGPLINTRGEVVGMQTWSTDPDGVEGVLSFAIGSEGLAAFVQQAGLRPYIAG